MQITIEKLVYGGDGLARTDQGVIFVPRSAPGDVLEVEIVRRKKDYATARIVRLITPSPDRQDPVCPNFETAGCCHWGHIRYDRQVDTKEAIIRESLLRGGRIEWLGPIERRLGPDRGYRMRAVFHVVHGRLGFLKEGTHEVVPVTECASLVPELNTYIGELNTQLAEPGFEKVREVHVLAPDATTGSRGVAFVPGEGLPDPRTLLVEVLGTKYEVKPDTFFQANRFLLEPFVQEVLDQAGPDPVHVLELFCGSGFFSIPLARRSREIIGIESSKPPVKQAQASARLNGVRNIQFVLGNVDAVLEGAEVHPDLVVLNPPRTGAGVKVAERVAGLKPKRIVYVSCNPATFAREAAVFARTGYALRRVTLVDQFPNTYHIELVALFERDA